MKHVRSADMLELSDFISHHTTTIVPSVHFFTGALEHSAFFLYRVRSMIGKKGIPIIVINPEEKEFTNLILQVETPFLGITCLFWIVTSSAEQKSKALQERIRYFLNYSGPHMIVFCQDISHDLLASIESKVPAFVVAIPETLDKKMAIQLVSMIAGDHRVPEAILEAAFQKISPLYLDSACMIHEYLLVAGKNRTSFMQDWFDVIISPDRSLFLLSQHFFAKKSKEFFQQWSCVSAQYAPQFWMTFWSEQLWRACLYIQLMKQNSHAEAKKISFRLPFSFIKKDWQFHDREQLQNAHEQIYAIDAFLKRGGDASGALELFFSRYLSKTL